MIKRTLSFLLCVLLFFSLGAYPALAKTDFTVKLSKYTYDYDGNVKNPSVIVTSGSKKLKNGTDYIVIYPSGRKYVGRYTVTVKMQGSYSGRKSVSFTISPAAVKLSSIKGGNRSLFVRWVRNTAQTSGYKLRYSTDKSFSKYKTLTVDSAGVSHCSISSLKVSTKYYVQIRAYKVIGDKVYYSAWSKTLSASTEKSSGSSTGNSSGVYITPTGKCYHFSKSCAGKNAKSTSYAFASANYRPCRNCVR